MGISTSRLSYKDCYDLFNQALETTKGARVMLDSYDDAVNLRMRLHQARKLERKANTEVYEPEHPMYGLSEFDRLMVKIKNIEGVFYLYVVPYGIDLAGRVESLDDVAEPSMPIPPPPAPEPEPAAAVPTLRRRF